LHRSAAKTADPIKRANFPLRPGRNTDLPCPGDRDKAMRADFAACIEKSVDPDTLGQAIARLAPGRAAYWVSLKLLVGSMAAPPRAVQWS
jgi:hypothetical protein